MLRRLAILFAALALTCSSSSSALAGPHDGARFAPAGPHDGARF